MTIDMGRPSVDLLELASALDAAIKETIDSMSYLDFEDVRKKAAASQMAIRSLQQAGMEPPAVLFETDQALQRQLYVVNNGSELLGNVRSRLNAMNAVIDRVLPATRPRTGTATGPSHRTPQPGPLVKGFMLGGTYYEAQSWMDVLRRLAATIIQREPERWEQIFAIRRAGRPVFGPSREALAGRSTPVYDTGVFMERMQNRSQVVSVTKELLALFGYDRLGFEIIPE